MLYIIPGRLPAILPNLTVIENPSEVDWICTYFYAKFVYFSFSTIPNNFTIKLILSIPPPGKKKKICKQHRFLIGQIVVALAAIVYFYYSIYGYRI